MELYKTSWLHLNFTLVPYSSKSNCLKNFLIEYLSERHKIGNDFIFALMTSGIFLWQV